MNTFLPYPSFTESAACLDRARLGKQRVETLQLLQVLAGETTAWANHPCTRMWRGHINALVYYGIVMCTEWKVRGYNDTLLIRISNYKINDDLVMPSWVGMPEFHASHRGNLLRKYPQWYGLFGWSDSPLLPYVWPLQRPILSPRSN